MELSVFMKVLESSLVKYGVPSAVAGQHAATLRTTFTKDDLADIENIRNESEVDAIAKGIASILNKSKVKSAEVSKPSVPQKSADAPKPAAQQKPAGSAKPSVSSKPASASEQKTDWDDSQSFERNGSPTANKKAQNSADFFAPPRAADKTQKGMLTFWGLLILTLPITLALLAIVLGTFALLYITLIVGIIGFIAALIGVAACGGGLSLIGIIYGITQLFSNVPAGIYEIGLGVIVAGLAVFTAVLLYNAAVRFLPWVMRWLTVFFSFVMDRLKYCFCLIRRECYKL